MQLTRLFDSAEYRLQVYAYYAVSRLNEIVYILHSPADL